MLSCALLSFFIGSALAVPQVQLGETTIIGAFSEISPQVEVFRSIPFALPPLGELRFQPPVLQTNLSGPELNATVFSPACLQEETFQTAHGMSEDCLNLDIYRPEGHEDDSLPVLVWIYGAGFTAGSSSLYDFSLFVNKSIARGTPIIAVALNYRVGQLGFPQGEEAESLNALNLGLKDQLTALQWIQTNIGAFGGDKDKVTISGESAGAHSVDVHLHGESLGQGLARGVIAQSTYSFPSHLPSDGNVDWAAFVGAVPECASTVNSSDTFTCLKQVNTSSLVNALNAGEYFQPVIDGPGGIYPDYFSQVKIGSPVPLLMGTNLDEGTLLTAQNVNSTDDIRAFLIHSCSPSPRGPEALEKAVDTIFELYPNDPNVGSPYGTGNETFGLSPAWKQFSAILGDFLFQSHTRALAAESSEEYNNPTYVYHFTDHNAVLPSNLFPARNNSHLGVPHAAELLFLGLFGPLGLWNITAPEAILLSEQIQDYWLSFITSLDPNDGKGFERTEWSEYTASGDPKLLQLDGKNLTMVPPSFRKEQIDFLNSDPVVFRK